MKQVIRNTTIRSNQTCSDCGNSLLKGDIVIVKTHLQGRTVKRNYYCLSHRKLTCTSCGKECFENDYPEIVFRDENNCICEECSIDYDEVDGIVQLREDI